MAGQPQPLENCFWPLKRHWLLRIRSQGQLAGSVLAPSFPWVCLPSPPLSICSPESPPNWNLILPLPGSHLVSWHVAASPISSFSSLPGLRFAITKAKAWRGRVLWSRSHCWGGVPLAKPEVQPPSLEMRGSNEGCLGTWTEALVCMTCSGLRCCYTFPGIDSIPYDGIWLSVPAGYGYLAHWCDSLWIWNVSFFYSSHHSSFSSRRIKSKQQTRYASCLRLAIGRQATSNCKRQSSI